MTHFKIQAETDSYSYAKRPKDDKSERGKTTIKKKREYAKNSVSSEHKTHIITHTLVMKLAFYAENKRLDFDLALGDAESKRHCATSCASTDRQSSVKEDVAPTRFSFFSFF